MPEKIYLGDGVYAEYDGMHIILTTDDGYHQTNKIYLDDQVTEALKRFIHRIENGEKEKE